MAKRFIEVKICYMWRKSRCTNSLPCQFKTIARDGRQGCIANGMNIDDPRREDSAANRAYDELKKKGYLK